MKKDTHTMTQERQSSSLGSGILWALIVAAALALVIVGRALWLQVRDNARNVGQPPPIAGGQNLLEAHRVVKIWAEQWQPDAAALNAATSYRRGEAPGEGWTFQIYSPSKRRIALVRVEGEEIVVLRETAALFAQTALPETTWQVDSSKALSFWWKQGGQNAWMNRRSDTLHLRFGLNRAADPTWQISISQTGGLSLAFWEITADATTVVEQSIP